eukprot:11116047-Alexandrium_andersonii.AAC.1
MRWMRRWHGGLVRPQRRRCGEQRATLRKHGARADAWPTHGGIGVRRACAWRASPVEGSEWRSAPTSHHTP